MSSTRSSLPPPEALEHVLSPHLPGLMDFHSTRRLESSPEYTRIRGEVERIMSTVVGEDFGPSDPPLRTPLRATAWNIERGLQVQGVIENLTNHPRMRHSDILFLTEVDFGMARSGNLCVAREIAGELELNYAYANCYISLVKGSGLEFKAQGENRLSLHGNALFSRFPLRQAHAVALPNGKDKMRGKEKRLGCQQAVVGRVDHPVQPFWAITLHLDAHSSQNHRYLQMKLILDHVETLQPGLPVLIGGDWNTSTYNARRAAYSILGYARRVLMGINNVLLNHYPYPDRWFERKLFQEVERRGYEYRSLNQPGACTLHYEVNDLAINTNMGDWIPDWCFWFIRWALKDVGGKCSMKLDWFAGRDIVADSSHPPAVLDEIHDRENPLSDHDPIVLDFHVK